MELTPEQLSEEKKQVWACQDLTTFVVLHCIVKYQARNQYHEQSSCRNEHTSGHSGAP